MKNRLKRLYTLSFLLYIFLSGTSLQAIQVDQLRGQVRDPFIYADPQTQKYYLHVCDQNRAIRLWESSDLIHWTSPGLSFTPPAYFWGKDSYWAPDLYHYNGLYYIFCTFSSETINRSGGILVSSAPNGPFEPLINRPITPTGWTCIDPSLYIDENGDPWLIFVREWVEVTDGEMWAQRLSPNLENTIGEPQKLFSATQAGWPGKLGAGYITDAPFIYRTPNGALLMLWSTFTQSGKYAIAIARSASGSVLGPWVHDPTPYYDKDGGHAMLFTDFTGDLLISYHVPNNFADNHPVIEKFDLNRVLGFPVENEIIQEEFNYPLDNEKIGLLDVRNFQEGTANWICDLDKTHPLSGQSSARFQIQNGGSEWWALQLRYDFVPVKKDEQFEVSCLIRSDKPATIQFRTQSASDFVKEITLEGNNKIEKVNFITTPMDRDALDAVFLFGLGNIHSTTITLDSLIISRFNVRGAQPDQNSSSFVGYKAGSQFVIKNGTDQTRKGHELRFYSSSGKLISAYPLSDEKEQYFEIPTNMNIFIASIFSPEKRLVYSKVIGNL